MANAIWTGSLSLGLVVVPVRLYPAVRKKAVRFHELDSRGRRVRHARVSEPELEPDSVPQMEEWPDGANIRRFPGSVEPRADFAPASFTPSAALPIEEIRKGFEVAPGEYVSLSREEVQELAPERSRAIEIEQFVEVAAVDPIYFESRYYVAPDRDAVAPFRVLRQAMADAGRMAIGWVTLRQRRHLCAIRPSGQVMLLTTMVHADEVLPADFWLPEPAARPTEKELKMARLLIDAMAAPFVAGQYTDEHRRRVLEAIQAKTLHRAAAAPRAASSKGVLDLMAALEASVKAARAARAAEGKPARTSRKRSGKGAG